MTPKHYIRNTDLTTVFMNTDYIHVVVKNTHGESLLLVIEYKYTHESTLQEYRPNNCIHVVIKHTHAAKRTHYPIMPEI